MRSAIVYTYYMQRKTKLNKSNTMRVIMAQITSGLFLLTALLFPVPSSAETVDILFPVLGGATYSNDWGNPRSGGRTHEGNDMFAPKHTPLVAVTDGVVSYVAYPEPSYGYAIFLRGDDGYSYWYLHMNNDTPGTDDGLGDGMNAYAPYMEQGNRVKAGQLVGWMGDSGNAEHTATHLHFEIHRPSDNEPINPYESLVASTIIHELATAPEQEQEIVPFGQAQVNTSIAVCRDERFVEEEGSVREFLVVGAGEGGGPQVQVYKLPSMKKHASFFAYGKEFRGGVDVSCGDTTGDGRDEIITAPGPGGAPHIRMLTLKGRFVNDFYAYKKSFRGGVNVAAADLNGNGKSAVIVAPKGERKPTVQVYSAKGNKLRGFRAYAKEWTNGLDITAVPANEERKGRIITSANPGGGAEVRLFTHKGKKFRSIWPYGQNFRGGVRVTAEEQENGSVRILTAPAEGGGPSFHLYNMRGRAITYESAFEPWWKGGYDVALSTAHMWFGTRSSLRRASVRWEDL